MSNNYFGEDEESEFRDIPDEVANLDERGAVQAPPAHVASQRIAQRVNPQPSPIEQAITEDYEEAQEMITDEDEDFSTVLSDARLRLEQGKLYEMIMNHDIFNGVEADDRAIKHVQKQIRNFAKEQMEIMLGMRQEAPKVQAMSIENFPFNDVEVLVLKTMASTFSKGKTESPEAQTFSGIEQPRRAAGLNTIGAPKKAAPAPLAPKPAAKPAPAQKPLAQKPAAPVKRDSNREAIINRILAEEGITREQYEAVFPTDYSALNKPFDQMSEEEVKERARQMHKRSPGQVKNSQAIPMPTQDQENMLHAQRVQAASANPQMQGLMNLLLTQKK
jgi:hypothetical protein